MASVFACYFISSEQTVVVLKYKTISNSFTRNGLKFFASVSSQISFSLFFPLSESGIIFHLLASFHGHKYSAFG